MAHPEVGMSTKKLTPKQAAFVNEYLVDLNAAGAARRAGYSERTAAEVGYENLRKPQIKEAIEKAIEERAEHVELTANEVIEGLRREARFTGEGSSHSARVQALSWLGRHKAMFTDKSQVEVKGLADRIAAMGDDEVRELLELGSDEEIIARLAGRVGNA